MIVGGVCLGYSRSTWDRIPILSVAMVSGEWCTPSVIIPTLNEAACIAAAIESLRRQGPCEIIVVVAAATTRLAPGPGRGSRPGLAAGSRRSDEHGRRSSLRGKPTLFARGLHARRGGPDGGGPAGPTTHATSRGVSACASTRADLFYRCIDAAATAARAPWRHRLRRSGTFLLPRRLRAALGLSAHRLHGRHLVQPPAGETPAHRRAATADRRVAAPLATRRPRSANPAQLDADRPGPAGGVHPDTLARWYPGVR